MSDAHNPYRLSTALMLSKLRSAEMGILMLIRDARIQNPSKNKVFEPLGVERLGRDRQAQYGFPPILVQPLHVLPDLDYNAESRH